MHDGELDGGETITLRNGVSRPLPLLQMNLGDRCEGEWQTFVTCVGVSIGAACCHNISSMSVSGII